MKLQDDYLERLSIRFLQDALASATRTYWLRRADELEACRSRPDDYQGLPLNSWDELIARSLRQQARDDRLTLMVEQCRIHAELFDHYDVDEELIAEVLGYDLVADVPERMAA